MIRFRIVRDGRGGNAKPWGVSVTETIENGPRLGPLNVADDPEQAIRQLWRYLRKHDGGRLLTEKISVTIEPEPTGQLVEYRVAPGRFWDSDLKKYVYPPAWFVLAHSRRHAVDLAFVEIASASKIPADRSYHDGRIGCGKRWWYVDED